MAVIEPIPADVPDRRRRPSVEIAVRVWRTDSGSYVYGGDVGSPPAGAVTHLARPGLKVPAVKAEEWGLGPDGHPAKRRESSGDKRREATGDKETGT